ncbi:MAG: hypothetical protein ISS41_08150 [Candidatus Aminicenantes bacterium]|nr:hypothetical protein [Candidatus Aminicenantes bacterium]MBL7083586.1 hypothetical protein [Candidatus Aminicenantes bacterium]
MNHSIKEIWEATISTFFSKFIIALIFLIPIFLFQLSTAIIVSVILGLFLLGIVSSQIGKKQEVKT